MQGTWVKALISTRKHSKCTDDRWRTIWAPTILYRPWIKHILSGHETELTSQLEEQFSELLTVISYVGLTLD